jgi:3-methyl-2-oxobutanoate hydroxymethyltransferase
MDEIIYHTKAVARGVNRSLLVSDLPFLSYQVSLEEAKRNAGLLIKNGANAVKIEVNPSQIEIVKAIVDMGIPVMGHIGFTPQQVYQLGGYKVQGKTDEAQERLIQLALDLERVGCFSLVLELMPKELAKRITDALYIPTISCGAGVYCSGQVLVTQDLLGITQGKKLKFVKSYINLYEKISQVITEYKSEVNQGIFPDDDHSF